MTANICSDEISSSDDEYYNNFTKYKAKTLALRRVEKGKDSKQNRKNGRNALEKAAKGLTDSKVNISSEICLVPTTDTSVVSDVIELVDVTDSTLADSSLLPIIKPSFSNTCRISIVSKGQQKIFFLDLNEPLANVIEEFAERTNVDPKRVNLYTKQYKRCEPYDTPLTLGLSERSTELELDAFEDLEEGEGKRIALKYQMKERRPTIVRVLPDATFAVLKDLFCTDHGLDLFKTRFLLGSTDLIGDEETPNSLGLEDGDCIDVIHFEN